MARNFSGDAPLGNSSPKRQFLSLGDRHDDGPTFFGWRRRGGKGGEGGNGGGKLGRNWGATFDAERAKRRFQKIQKHPLYRLQPAQLARLSELRRVSKPPYSSGVGGEKRR